MSCGAAAGRVRVQLATAGLEGLAAALSAPASSGCTSVSLASASRLSQRAAAGLRNTNGADTQPGGDPHRLARGHSRAEPTLQTAVSHRCRGQEQIE
ncbi:Hypothetical protein GSB_151228 [Giardia duodenalis]|uniref:Uncharacterized protein n=1 Tax=Giardia intestinalis TaxID=5741 RepID=V6U1K2_GIAIN|nr:Hypothetical protein GSB_151228 [Giardia intestinalis]